MLSGLPVSPSLLLLFSNDYFKESAKLVVSVQSLREALRSDPKFNILCDRKRMEKRKEDGSFIPQIISLPEIPGVSSPKGFEASSSFQYFLLSEQRFKLYAEMDDFIHGKSKIQGAGSVPSGPHGIGKTGVGLLLACYAFLNKHVVIYFVSLLHSIFTKICFSPSA
jgi:hypothetical protein